MKRKASILETNEYLLWLDIETTGLDPQNNEIIELAYVLTDFKLNNIYAENHFIIKPQTEFDNLILNMNEWCKNQHSKSGLLEKVKTSICNITDVENNILNLLSTLEKNQKVYLAGNSVHFDKSFINQYMKNLSNKISYRIVDVSSFAIICKNLDVDIYDKRPLKKYKHTALSDIWESINEYQYYLRNFIKYNDITNLGFANCK
jgi:oligoribonuclease